jgi:ABC-2 type transport system permease protein
MKPTNEISSMQRMISSVQREIWENRSIYIAPLLAAFLFVIGFLIGKILPHPLQNGAVATPYLFAAGFIMATTVVVAAIYSLDALYGERRDRSILFWKSLPVSDLTTVLSKASIPIVIIPLLAFAVTFVTWCIMLLLSAVLPIAGGLAPMWKQMSFFQMSLLVLYHLITAHGLWYAPIFCWLLMVSAWARRAPLLWASLPLIAIVFAEKIAFGTSVFADLLKARFTGGADADTFMSDSMSMQPLAHISPLNFITSPGLWIGLAFSAVCLAIAVRLRRDRGPI